MPNESPLYLLARLPADVRGHAGATNDRGGARPRHKPVEDRRLHVTLAVFDAVDAPLEHVVQLICWIMATIPPFAFRIAYDALIVGPRSALLKARDPAHGALACQAHIATLLRDYGVELPKRAMPAPHVTLGHGYREFRDAPGTYPPSWLIDELLLVRGQRPVGHDVLAQWQLPRSPDERRAPDREVGTRQMDFWSGCGAVLSA